MDNRLESNKLELNNLEKKLSGNSDYSDVANAFLLAVTIARELRQVGNHIEAVNYFLKASDFARSAKRVDMISKSYTDAIQSCEDAIKHNPNDVKLKKLHIDVLMTIGTSLVAQREFVGANMHYIKAREKALEINDRTLAKVTEIRSCDVCLKAYIQMQMDKRDLSGQNIRYKLLKILNGDNKVKFTSDEKVIIKNDQWLKEAYKTVESLSSSIKLVEDVTLKHERNRSRLFSSDASLHDSPGVSSALTRKSDSKKSLK